MVLKIGLKTKTGLKDYITGLVYCNVVVSLSECPKFNDENIRDIL